MAVGQATQNPEGDFEEINPLMFAVMDGVRVKGVTENSCSWVGSRMVTLYKSLKFCLPKLETEFYSGALV